MVRFGIVCIVFASASFAASPPTLDLQLVASNVTNPVYVTHAADDSGRLFIVEQVGRIKIFDGTNLLATPFLDITNQVLFSGEQGLLSMGFHPGYKTNGHFYVYFTNPTGSSNVVARFTAVPSSTNVVNTNTLLTVLRISHPDNDNHNGGQIQFGPDAFLYIATGDGGSSCDPPNNAQNLGSLLGKILRIDVNNFTTNYTIPPSNPFVATNGARPEIWAYGLRNPWRFSFDRLTGDMFIGDVGQGTREEIDFQSASSAGGENYGWKCIEGTSTNTCGTNCVMAGMIPPILQYSRNPSRAVTGGYRYRGNLITPLFGTYVFADYFSPAPIWGATNTTAGAWNTNLLLTAAFNISSFGEDQRGELYVCRHETAGEIYRIVWKDSDSDGLPDDWEQQYFGSTTGADPNADPDRDGFPNLQEFLAGTDPTNNASALRITSITLTGGEFEVRFTTAINKLYRLERTDDLLTTWTPVTNLVGTGGVLLVVDPSGAGQTQRFYRVRLNP